VNWLHRIGRQDPEGGIAEGGEEAGPAPLERSAPGIAVLLDGFTADGSLSILDLGPASESSFRVYSQFARRIQFADILAGPCLLEDTSRNLRDLGSDSHPRFDLVLAWNILDHLYDSDRSNLVKRLVQLTKPGARLYVLVDSSGRSETYPLRFSLLGQDRVLQQPTGPRTSALPELLPAELERLLMPFRVSHAFTLRKGWREYVAINQEGNPALTRGHALL
jgi:hypothetical protein